MDVPTPAQRAEWLARLDEPGAHELISARLDCLRSVDVVDAPEPATADRWLRVAAWNVERGRDPARIAELLCATGAHVALLSELDVGMGRTGNIDVGRAVARGFGSGLAFGVEFVELSVGSVRDAEVGGGRVAANTTAVHGNAICSRIALRDPAVVRLDGGGHWFTADRGEPRVGGRMAVVGTVDVAGADVTVASVHLESHSDPAHRAAEMTVVFDAIDARGLDRVVIGGDLNTFGARMLDLADRDAVRRMRGAEPARFSWPVAHEPLFEVAAARGYGWVDANVVAPTSRHGPDALPDHQPLRLDWILVRGLEARRPVVVPATDRNDSPISDHELLAVSVRP